MGRAVLSGFQIGTLLALVLVTKASPAVIDKVNGGQKLVVIMLDGFRWNYVDSYSEDLPNFNRFLADGVRAEWVETVFPSVSYANWATISTGLYPESSQHLGNTFFDRNETDPGQVFFSLGYPPTTKLLKWWQETESIWTTATKAGKRVFLRYWSRCDVPYQGILPEECEGYGGEKNIEDVKVSIHLALDRLNAGFDLVMVHIDQIDHAGHAYGPMSPQMLTELKKMDAVIGDFIDRLQDNGLDDQVNIIMVSDHGMRYVGEGADTVYINLDDVINREEVIRVVDYGTLASIAVVDNSLENVYSKLKGVKGLQVYMREEIPEEYHYRGGKYVLDILLVPQKGYLLRGLVGTEKQIPELESPNSTYTGVHGYAPDVTDMRAIFFARGPAFKRGYVNPPIHMVDVYQLYGSVLNISLQPHNGTWTSVSNMLLTEKSY